MFDLIYTEVPLSLENVFFYRYHKKYLFLIHYFHPAPPPLVAIFQQGEIG